MFIVQTNPTFKRRVEIRKPTMSGAFADQSFWATYVLLDTEEIGTFDLMKADDTTSFLQRIVIDLSDVVGEDKQPIPYSESLRDLVIKDPVSRRGLIDSYFEGIQPARKGN